MEVTSGCECVAVNRMLDEVFSLHVQVIVTDPELETLNPKP